MRRVTAIQLNEAHEAFLIDPENQVFWKILTDYVAYCSYSVPSHLRADFVQSVVLEIFKSMGGFRAGSNFAKFVNALIRNTRADSYKAGAREKEVIVMGEDLLEDHDDPDVPVDQREVRHQLDAMHATLKQPQALLFNLLRQGHSLHQAASILEQPYRTVLARWQRLKANFIADLASTTGSMKMFTMKAEQACTLELPVAALAR